MTLCCDGPFGAVRPWVWPSWFTADPRISARIGSFAASALESRLSTMTPHPSPRTKPSARASKVLHLPSADSACSLETATPKCGDRSKLEAPTIARSHSLLRRLLVARCSATSDEEHAVSTERLGPLRSSKYERRLATTLRITPVAVYVSMSAGSASWSSP